MIDADKMKIDLIRVSVATALLYILLSVIPSKPVGVAAVFVYAGVLFGLLRNVDEALLVAFTAVTPFSLGKFFPIDLVSGQQLHLLNRPFGISSDIAITTRDMTVAVMALRLCIGCVRTKRIRIPTEPAAFFLLLLPFVLTVSALAGSVRPGLSILHTLFYLEPYIVYIFVRSAKHMRYDRMLIAASVAVLFESVLVVVQNVRGAPLGLIVESFPQYIPVDVSTDAQHLLRLGGTFDHANSMAHFLLFFGLCITPGLFAADTLLRRITALAVSGGIIALLLSLSRSAWASVFMGVVVLVFLLRKYDFRATIYSDVRVFVACAALVLFILAYQLVIPRLMRTSRTFEKYGSGEMRLSLLREGIPVMLKHPWFGVGMGMDVYVSYRRAKLTGIPIPSYFPEPVQNGFLQLLMQTGITGLAAYLAALSALGFVLWKEVRKTPSIALAGIVAAVVAVTVNSQLQPILPDMTFIAFLAGIHFGGQMPRTN